MAGQRKSPSVRMRRPPVNSAAATGSPETGRLVRRLRHAVADLRLGWPVRVELSGGRGLLAIAADAVREPAAPAPAAAIARARPAGELWLSAPRAAVLHLPHKGRPFVALELAAGWDPDELAALVDPTRDLARPWKGPWPRVEHDAHADALAETLFALLRAAGRLPAVLITAGDVCAGEDAPVTVTPAMGALLEEAAPQLVEIARAALPLERAPETRIVAFRQGDGGPEHFALLIGDPLPRHPVLVRLHSECFTGDHLGSLKCDCGDQLAGALARLAAEPGGGILLYLAQEGRGIGLIAKLKAYALQDQGFDTIEANERLGFAADHRNFAIAAAMLKALGFTRIRLLTNNPDKVAALEAAGITVLERVPHRFPARPENARYLDAKRRKAGHDL